jgi:hypothetical protein
LSGKVHQDEILRIVHEAGDFKSACQQLINLANERGGEDNITVVIAQFSGAGLALPESEPLEPQSLARSPDTPTEINWRTGSATDQLNAQTEPVGDLSNISDSGATQPLRPPPAQSTPFTSKADRATTELTRNTDALDRREPTTLVFGPEDLNDDPHISPFSPVKTDPFGSRDTRPINPENLTPVLTRNQSGSKTDGQTPAAKGAQSNSKDGHSRRNYLILVGLMALGIGGLAVGVYAHFKQRAQARADQQKAELKIEIQNQKDGKIGGLRDRIAELNKRLEASDKPSLKKKRDISESLNRLSQRLDDIYKMSSDQLSDISQACEEIGKELNKIEEEINSEHGLLPSLETNREPIKI